VNDRKLLQESNLIAWQSRIHLINQHRHLAKEGLLVINLTGDKVRELSLPAPSARCYPLLYGPPKSWYHFMFG